MSENTFDPSASDAPVERSAEFGKIENALKAAGHNVTLLRELPKGLDKYLCYADQPTPQPQSGLWILMAPDGRTFAAESPMKCVQAEMHERVPPHIALGRIARALKDPE